MRTQATIAKIIMDNPWLIAMDSYRAVRCPQGLAYFHAAVAYLRCCRPAARGRPAVTTYAFKHQAEPFIGYIPDALFAIAAVHCGFAVTPFQGSALCKIEVPSNLASMIGPSAINVALETIGCSADSFDSTLREIGDRSPPDAPRGDFTFSDTLHLQRLDVELGWREPAAEDVDAVAASVRAVLSLLPSVEPWH